MKKNTALTIFTALAAALLFASCATTKVSRVSSDTVIDLSGYWNDTDVRLAAEQIIEQCVTSPRIATFPAQHAGKSTPKY